MDMKQQRGFTLVEIMVVVVILGILAAVIAPNILDNPHKARVAKVKADIQALENALDLYKLDNFVYPNTDQGLESLVTKLGGQPEPPNYKAGGYIKKLPDDPWGNPYQFLNPGANGLVDIYSFGTDGRSGGEGEATDIGNWNLDEF